MLVWLAVADSRWPERPCNRKQGRRREVNLQNPDMPFIAHSTILQSVYAYAVMHTRSCSCLCLRVRPTHHARVAEPMAVDLHAVNDGLP